MSITKNLVDLMHGSIRVESKKNKGSVFTVEIPFGLAEQKIDHSPDKFKSIHALIVDDESDTREYTSEVLKRIGIAHDIASDGEQAMKLLTAEHSKGSGYDICFIDWRMPGLNGIDVTRKIREIACELLEMVNMQVDCAINGDEVVKMLEDAPAGTYDAILMDIQMPVMNGYEATEVIRSGTYKQSTIPIFAMTANAFTEDVSASIASGMNGHISKPIDTEILYQTLQKVLEEKE